MQEARIKEAQLKIEKDRKNSMKESEVQKEIVAQKNKLRSSKVASDEAAAASQPYRRFIR